MNASSRCLPVLLLAHFILSDLSSAKSQSPIASILPMQCQQRLRGVLYNDLQPFLKEPISSDILLYADITDARLFANEIMKPAVIPCKEIETFDGLRRKDQNYVRQCEWVYKSIKTKDREKINDSVSSCFKAWLRYRQFISESLTDRRPLAEVDDIVLLESRLAPALLNEGALNVKEIAQIAERLVELYGRRNLYSRQVIAARFVAQAHYVDLRRHGLRDLAAEEKTKKLEKSLQRLDRLSHDDPVIILLRLSRLKEDGNLKKLVEEANKYSKSHPADTLADFFLAWAAYEQDDKKKALHLLDGILQRSPDNFRATHARHYILNPTRVRPGLRVFLDTTNYFGGMLIEFPS